MAQARGQSSRALPPRRRSALGPFTFLLVIALLVVGLYTLGRPLAEEVLAQYLTEHDTLLRQDIVRGLVSDRVRSEVDLARDTRADTRPFVIARGETAGEIAKHLEREGVIRSALAFDYVLYEMERENALQSGTYTVSAALTPRELAKLFEKAPGEQIVLRIIEGWRLTEVATAVTDRRDAAGHVRAQGRRDVTHRIGRPECVHLRHREARLDRRTRGARP